MCAAEWKWYPLRVSDPINDLAALKNELNFVKVSELNTGRDNTKTHRFLAKYKARTVDITKTLFDELSRQNVLMIEKPHEVRKLSSAAELLGELFAPNGGILWGASPDHVDTSKRWLFRGQKDSSWKLQAGALRAPISRTCGCQAEADAFKAGTLRAPAPLASWPTQKFADGNVQPTDELQRRKSERECVMRFFIMADRHGHHVPGDSQEFRDVRGKFLESPPQPGFQGMEPTKLDRFPVKSEMPMFALAQHYGIPTRLLDWTYSPFVAAYFAVEKIAFNTYVEPAPDLSGTFSVFALHEDVFVPGKAGDTLIDRVSVPYASNQNLHAQKGVFTLVECAGGTADLSPPTIEDVVANMGANTTLLVEFQVPKAQARTVLAMLSLYGVSAASIYPGLNGVATAVAESHKFSW